MFPRRLFMKPVPSTDEQSIRLVQGHFGRPATNLNPDPPSDGADRQRHEGCGDRASGEDQGDPCEMSRALDSDGSSICARTLAKTSWAMEKPSFRMKYPTAPRHGHYSTPLMIEADGVVIRRVNAVLAEIRRTFEFVKKFPDESPKQPVGPRRLVKDPLDVEISSILPDLHRINPYSAGKFEPAGVLIVKKIDDRTGLRLVGIGTVEEMQASSGDYASLDNMGSGAIPCSAPRRQSSS